MFKERRKHHRLATELHATFRVMAGVAGHYISEPLPATVQSLSELGCCLALEDDVAQGLDLACILAHPESHPLDLTVRAPGGDWHLVALARWAGAVAEGRAGGCRVGAVFSPLGGLPPNWRRIVGLLP